MKNSKSILLVLMISSLCMMFLEISLNIQEEFLSDATQTIWGLAFGLLSVLWMYYDSKQSKIEKPFDFGFLVYILWPIALPWYVISTRGLEGILLFLGFIALWIGPWLSGVVAYYYWA